jgi:hypothetical protein
VLAEATASRQKQQRRRLAERVVKVLRFRDCSSEERRSIAKIANARGVVLVVDEPWGRTSAFIHTGGSAGPLARGG